MNMGPKAGSERGRVLVIDDDDLVRTTVTSILEAAGLELAQAEDGQEGLRLYSACSFDLVITDILMPAKEGIETIRELRLRKPDVKIIAISGGGNIGANQILGAAQKLGADDVLSKPFNKAELLEKVRTCMSAGKPAKRPYRSRARTRRSAH